MSVGQREARLLRMVESRVLPPRNVVAAVALRAESSLVNIVARMASVAGTATKACVIRLIMTISAGEPPMTAGQRKSRHGEVIKVDRSP